MIKDSQPDEETEKTPADKVASFFDPLNRDGRNKLREEVLFLNR